MRHLMFATRLNVPPQRFWDHQSLASVNRELGPWLRMSAPARWRHVLLKDWPGGGPLFCSWVLLLGLVPIDRHAFDSLVFQPGCGFVEQSSSWLARQWRHERTVIAAGQGCEVVDRVDYVPRLAALSWLMKPIYIQVFRHRHSRLRQRYGTTP